MDTSRLDALIQTIYFTVNPVTSNPYPANLTPVADGQGLYRWQTVFQTISSQSATDGAPLGYLPSTIRSLGQTDSTLSTLTAGNFSTLSSFITQAVRPGDLATFSSLTNSTILYRGVNGDFTGAVSENSNLSFSTASLSLAPFSSLIVSSSRITAEFYPSYLFPPITASATATKVVPVSTLIQYGTNFVSSTHTSRIFANSVTTGFSNSFQQPIRLTFSGSNVVGRYAQPYVLYHTLQGAISFAPNIGFQTPDISAHFGSTNSLFISIENR